MNWNLISRPLVGATLATLLAAGAAQAGTYTSVTTVNVGGIASNDELGSAINEKRSVFLGFDAVITSISWNVQIGSVDESHLSEIGVNFTGTNGAYLEFYPGIADDFSGFGDYSGAANAADIAAQVGGPFQIGSDGVLNLEFFEFFDDFIGATDGFWESGSITITANAVPLPATLGLAGLALLAAGAARRRQAR